MSTAALLEATDAEKAELTPFNMAVYDCHRQNSQSKGVIPPFWLVMSKDAKEEARQGFLQWLDEKMPNLFGKHTIDSATRFIGSIVDSHPAMMGDQLDLWVEMEIGARKAREEGNPRAFFAG